MFAVNNRHSASRRSGHRCRMPSKLTRPSDAGPSVFTTEKLFQLKCIVRNIFLLVRLHSRATRMGGFITTAPVSISIGICDTLNLGGESALYLKLQKKDMYNSYNSCRCQSCHKNAIFHKILHVIYIHNISCYWCKTDKTLHWSNIELQYNFHDRSLFNCIEVYLQVTEKLLVYWEQIFFVRNFIF